MHTLSLHDALPISEAQLEDIEKLGLIARFCVSLAKTPLERYLSNLLVETVDIYVKATYSAINDPSLSALEVREIVIGESNLRVVATK
jgi:hypothetical protein